MVRTVTSFISLPWLPSPPDDFAALCSSAAASPDGGALLQYLAGHRLDSRKAILLARALARSRREGAVPGPLSNFRLGVLSNATVDMVVDYLAGPAS